MRVSFDFDIADDKKYELLYSINQDRIKFENFIKDMNLKMENDPFEFDIIVKEKIFGFITDGMVNYDAKQIIFYGTEDLNIITHEWTHVAFPNELCERHSEGLAIYVQMQLGKFHFHGFDTPLDFVKSYMHSSNRENVKNWLQFLKTSQYFYDARLGRMLISRALSAEFVSYLIGKYGLKNYIEKFYTKVRDNKNSHWLEDVEFSNFKDSLPKSSEIVLEPFLQLKSEFVDKYSRHFIPKTGSVLAYLITNRDKIDPDEYNYLQNIALEDLRTTLYFYS